MQNKKPNPPTVTLSKGSDTLTCNVQDVARFKADGWGEKAPASAPPAKTPEPAPTPVEAKQDAPEEQPPKRGRGRPRKQR